MPLPLPDLDNRQWADLVDEGVALVPRYARAWTDHNLHDPGITLIELFAWLVEQDMYRANRITDRARLKFLALLGYSPRPPRPASAVLGVTLAAGTGTLDLPAGLVFLATAPGLPPTPYTLEAPAGLVESRLAAVQVHDGQRFLDRTPAFLDRTPIAAIGHDPEPAAGEAADAGLYLGFEGAWPVDHDIAVWVRVRGGDHDQRRRLLAELAARAEDCDPGHECPPRLRQPGPWCAPAEGENGGGGGGASSGGVGATGLPGGPLPPHHSVRLAWEYLGAGGWSRLDPAAGEVVDDTRGLTLDGVVRFRLPGPTAAQPVGAVAAPLHWIRCRLVAGAWEAAPHLITLVLNPLMTRQRLEATGRFTIAAGVTPATVPAPGDRSRLDLRFDADGLVMALDPAPSESDVPQLLVVDYQPAGPGTTGEVVVPLRPVLRGTGLPEQHGDLGAAPVADGELSLYAVSATGWEPWDQRRDLDASGPLDAHFRLAATEGEVRIGDGVRGRVVEAGARVLGRWSSTRAEAGAVPAEGSWALAAEPDSILAVEAAALNRALLGADPAGVAAALEVLSNADPAFGGADEEAIGEAAARAAARLWAHERLVELCPADSCETLDQLPRDDVLDRPAPPRAVTALDFERIALDVPGTRVRRARAWPGLDGRYACMEAPGTVTLVIVPELPRGRPVPTPGLVGAVRRYIDRRRTLCARVVVVGPRYRVVRVVARLRARSGGDPARIAESARSALDTFLDPLVGGPAGRGWPFGRDVYRSEVLHVLDGVPGVDHVLELELAADSGEAGCGNICIGPTTLTVSGHHAIEVVPA